MSIHSLEKRSGSCQKGGGGGVDSVPLPVLISPVLNKTQAWFHKIHQYNTTVKTITQRVQSSLVWGRREL